jgi:hypothetical protein
MRIVKNIDLEKYAHVESDPWRWAPAAGTDCQDITDMALVDFARETDDIFENDPIEYQRNIMLTTVNQFYNPKLELLSVARLTGSGSLVAYTWAKRYEYAPWSKEEMVAVRMAHIDQQISARARVTLCAQMIRMWEVWAQACDIKIICSSTVRGEQTAFLDLHRAAGYSVRGSVAYKRLNKTTIEIDTPGIILTGKL